MKTTLIKTGIIISTILITFSSCKNEGEGEEGVPGVFMALNDWSAARTYPNKKMIAASFDDANDQMYRMNARQRNAKGTATAALTDWTGIAPKNFAGRIISLGFHPTNANIMFAGSASGGLWKTTTGGTGAAGGINWTYVSTGFPVIGVGCITFNPSNGNEIYVGTGEVYDNGAGGADGANVTSAGYIRTFRGSYGVGIIKSTDGGVTWTKSLDFSYSSLKGVWDILIDPTNTSTVYAATTDGVYRSTNSGGSWTLIHDVVMATDLCFKPGSYDVMYVACGNFASPGYGIYKSIDVDAATPTFIKLAGGLPTTVINGKIQLAISAANPNKVYASIGKAPGTSNVFALYSSTDEGDSWTQVITAASAFTGSGLNQGWYAHDVAVSPTNANRVYWAEMDFFTSSNGGSSFTRETVWSNWNVNFTTVGGTAEGTSSAYVHADVHRVYVSPFSNTTLFVCTDGGIFKSTDDGNAWIGLNGGLQTAQIYNNVSVSPTNANLMIAGMQDNEGLIYNGSPGCARIPNLGDGFHTAIHPTTPTTWFIASYYFNVKKSTNSGSSWSSVTSNPGVPPSENAAFNAPFVIAKSSPATMYGGTTYLKRSTSSGASGSWVNMNGGARLSHSTAPILYIAVAPNDANYVYVSVGPGTGVRSKIFRSTNGGTSFTEITGTLPDRYYSSIAVDPTNRNRIAVAVSGFGSSHAFMSNNGGTDWIDIGDGLPDVPANAVLFDPLYPEALYIGNDIGVFATNALPITGNIKTNASNWLSYNGGFGDAVMVSDLIITPGAKGVRRLRAATYGRGLWDNAMIDDDAAFMTLPLQVSSFAAENKESGNELKWTMSSGSKVVRYEIEYSSNGVDFSKVGQVGARRSDSEETHAFHHQSTGSELKAYYRIKIIDADGAFEYSKVVEIEQVQNKMKIVMYPNPTRNAFRIQLPSRTTGSVMVSVIDQRGSIVKSERISLQGSTAIDQNVTGLIPGNYNVMVDGKSIHWTGKLIKVN
jgi:hypothetical protein